MVGKKQSRIDPRIDIFKDEKLPIFFRIERNILYIWNLLFETFILTQNLAMSLDFDENDLDWGTSDEDNFDRPIGFEEEL